MTPASAAAETTLAIIGGGPNCTYAVERLAVMLRRRAPAATVRIDIFEKTGFFGAGNVHRPDQPSSSLLNRIIGQVAFAPDESYTAAGDLLPRSLRPTMVEWAQARYRLSRDEAYNLAPEDWPPRRLLGEALLEHFNMYLALLREIPGVEVHLHTAEVTRIDQRGERYVLSVGDDGTASMIAEHILLLTGNSVNRPRPGSIEARLAERARQPGFNFVPYPYPLRAIPDNVAAPGQVVGCIGLGQTANDVILYLTEERGGRFVPSADGDGLEYLPSGREPGRIVAISQSGVFTAARPYNQKLADPSAGDHTGVFFTNDAIDILRVMRGVPASVEGFGSQRQLDFERDVFPVMLLEMECLYYKTLFGSAFGAKVVELARPRMDAFLRSPAEQWTTDAASDFLLEPLRGEVARTVDLIDAFLARPDVGALSAAEQSVILSYLGVIFGERFKAQAAVHFQQQQRDHDGVVALLATSRSSFGHPLGAERHLFSWHRLIAPISPDDYHSPDEYRQAILAYMKYDLLQSAQGNIKNPTKAVTDGVWRDLRETISYAIDFAGVTAASHRVFLQKYLRYHNRLADGACIELMEKMRGLVRSGLLDVSTGPDPAIIVANEGGQVRICGPHTGSNVVVDAIIDAKLSNIDLVQDASPLYRSLLDNGHLKVWENPGHGIEEGFAPGGPALTRASNPIGIDGNGNSRISIIGPPSEGVMFFQGTLGRPFCNHQVLNEVIQWVKRFDSCLDTRREMVADGMRLENTGRE